MKKYALKNISQIKIVDGSVEIKYNDGALFKLKENFLRIKMYNNKKVLAKNIEGQKIIKYLFTNICKKPKKFIDNQNLNKNKFRSVSDFISGMTDRYAINLYNNLK